MTAAWRMGSCVGGENGLAVRVLVHAERSSRDSKVFCVMKFMAGAPAVMPSKSSG